MQSLASKGEVRVRQAPSEALSREASGLFQAGRYQEALQRFEATRAVAVEARMPRQAARATDPRFRETLAVIVPPVVLLLLALWLGLATPEVLRESWTAAVRQLYPTP